MAAKTAEQRKQDRLVAEAARLAAQLAVREAQALKNPVRLLKLMARAEAGHYCTSVTIKDGSVDPKDNVAPMLVVTFTFPVEDGNRYPTERTLTVFSDDWEFDELAGKFDAEDAARKAEEARRELARKTYDSLSEEQREALGLFRRP